MLLKNLAYHLSNNTQNIAFVINEQEYTYANLSIKISEIQYLLIQKGFVINDKVIIYTYDDIETYAAILAVWFLGGTFIPLNPKHPINRNELIQNQLKVNFTLSSVDNDKVLFTKNNKRLESKVIINQRETDSLMYVLFTSGSTGIPKGVPISYKNINSFIVDFASKYDIDSGDKFLQIYDLTFDASIHCYLLPLYIGASIYTISPKKIKYLEAYRLIDKKQLTFAKFPPSVLAYLKPYFNRINFPKLKYSLLGGESLSLELAKQWQECVPNAKVQNVYGPTEATINTHIYTIPNNNTAKTYNGTVTIGKPFGNNKAFVIDEKNQLVPKNTKGELCLYGNQITNQYFNSLTKTKHAFTTINGNFVYKTGDLVYQDEDGDYIFCGRIDNQVQIQGYRVELSEIEHASRSFKKALNYSVVSTKNRLGVLEIILFLEQLETETNELHQYLKNRLPFYMVPSKIINLAKFPQTAGGKIDKQALIKSL